MALGKVPTGALTATCGLPSFWKSLKLGEPTGVRSHPYLLSPENL